MILPHRFSVPAGELDFALSVSCGQVFRFRQEEGVWSGVIAGQVYRASLVDGCWEVQSTEQEGEFRHTFDLEGERSAAGQRIAAADPWLVELIESDPGLAFIRQRDPVEVIFSFICSANNHVRRIEQMVRNLGDRGPEFARGFHGFPSLEVLASVPESDLRTAGFGYRSGRVPACALAILDRGGVAWIESLRSLSSDDALFELEALPGVGPKLAECIALFGLGHHDVFPVDTHMFNVVRRRYLPNLGPNLTIRGRREIRESMRDRFGKDAGRAHHVLFVDELRNWRSRR